MSNNKRPQVVGKRAETPRYERTQEMESRQLSRYLRGKGLLRTWKKKETP